MYRLDPVLAERGLPQQGISQPAVIDLPLAGRVWGAVMAPASRSSAHDSLPP
jgi:hypothetical protein